LPNGTLTPATVVSPQIDLQVQPFQRVRTQHHHVAGLGEHHQFGRFGTARFHQRIAEVSLDPASVTEDDSRLTLNVDAELSKCLAGNPGVLAAGVNDHVV